LLLLLLFGAESAGLVIWLLLLFMARHISFQVFPHSHCCSLWWAKNNNTKESTENNNNNWLQKTSPKKIDNGRCRSSICKCTQCTMYNVHTFVLYLVDTCNELWTLHRARANTQKGCHCSGKKRKRGGFLN